MHKLFYAECCQRLLQRTMIYSTPRCMSLRGGHTQNQHKTKKYYSVRCDNRHAVLLTTSLLKPQHHIFVMLAIDRITVRFCVFKLCVCPIFQINKSNSKSYFPFVPFFFVSLNSERKHLMAKSVIAFTS